MGLVGMGLRGIEIVIFFFVREYVENGLMF